MLMTIKMASLMIYMAGILLIMMEIQWMIMATELIALDRQLLKPIIRLESLEYLQALRLWGLKYFNLPVTVILLMLLKVFSMPLTMALRSSLCL